MSSETDDDDEDMQEEVEEEEEGGGGGGNIVDDLYDLVPAHVVNALAHFLENYDDDEERDNGM